MYQQPRRAKRLYFDVIPRQVDEYLSALEKFPGQTPAERLDNPVWHIHDGAPPDERVPVSFGLLLNLASVCNSEDKNIPWGFVSRYVPEARPETHRLLDRLLDYAVAYYRDFVKPSKRYRAPSAMERAALADLVAALSALPPEADAEAIQTEVYEVGKRHPFPDLRAWFQALYEILLGQTQGPRMGSFIALYGKQEMIARVRAVLDGAALA
jgi:lysyl-tRNA synthetase class 1